MKRILIPLALLTMIACQSYSARERRNWPKILEVSAALKSVGGVHSEITDIEEVASHRTHNSYLHIFSGKLNQESCALIFDNKARYLGYYNLEEDMSVEYIERHGIISFESSIKSGGMRLGNRGPWREVEAYYRVFRKTPIYGRMYDRATGTLTFNPTEHYIAPSIETETRAWTVKEEDVFAKLVDVCDESVFLKNTDSDVVYSIFDDRLTNDDRKYIKTIEFEE